MERLLCTATNLTIHPFDAGKAQRLSLVEIVSGPSTRRFTVPEALGNVLASCRKSTPEEQFQTLLSDSLAIDATETMALIEEYLIPKGLISRLGEGGQPVAPPVVDARTTHSIRGRLIVLSAPAVRRITTILQVMFSRPLLILGGFGIIYSQAVLLSNWRAYSPASLDGREVLWFFLFSTIASLFHEFGHASALRHYGSDHAPIGWGLYLWFPVLYTDLSHAWRLSRRNRVIVDLGGIFFHLLFVAFLVLLSEAYGVHALRGLSFLIEAEIVLSLNPFFKMDGYWMIADLLGSSDLRGEAGNVFTRFLRNSCEERHVWTNRERIVALYCVASATFFLYITVVLTRDGIAMLPTVWPQLRELRSLLHASATPVSAFALLLIELMWKVLFVIGVLFTVEKLCHLVYSFAAQGKRSQT